MGRNWEKYMYVELAIPRNSAWFPLLEAEATAKGQPMAQIALERLASAYLSHPTAPLPPANWTSAASRTSLANAALPTSSEQVDEPQLSEEQATNNASAFLDNGGFF